VTLPAWPSGLSSDTTSEWAMSEMFIPPIATDMDGGNQRLRTRPGSNVAAMSYPLQPLTEAEWDTLNSFLRDTLNNGASRFTMDVWTGAAYESKTVQLDGGKSPQVSWRGTYVNVVLSLRVFGM
jgi:hypothetical protein